jgi:hypothetical protein
VPFVFATGYGARGLCEDFRDRPVLQKPFKLRDLERALSGALDRGRRPVAAAEVAGAAR